MTPREERIQKAIKLLEQITGKRVILKAPTLREHRIPTQEEVAQYKAEDLQKLNDEEFVNKRYNEFKRNIDDEQLAHYSDGGFDLFVDFVDVVFYEMDPNVVAAKYPDIATDLRNMVENFEYERPICRTCNGSGMGQRDGGRCASCGGSGAAGGRSNRVRGSRYDPDYESDYDDDY